MTRGADYSIHYTSSPAAARANGEILIPGGASTASQSRANSGAKGPRDDEGVVITPDPSGIVIKTRLAEKRDRFSFDDDDRSDHEPRVPRSLSSIYAASRNDPEQAKSSESDESGDETKVFLNVCTHPLVAAPGRRKGLDEETGEEVDGWRLPVSVGDLRPCYDKSGNAAVAADCVLNPGVVREMESDPNRFRLVCDLIVRCASRKFGRARFGGRELDGRFKLPKMRYAGYVDEATGLPIVPEGADGALGDRRGDGGGRRTRKSAVAKQRVKGHGGKSPMIEEVARPGEVSAAIEDGASRSKPPKGGRVEQKTAEVETDFRIELFVCDGDESRTPLFEFLKLAAEQDDGAVPRGQPSATLRKLIKSPKLKPRGQNGFLHESQLLKTPMPFRIGSFDGASESPRSKGGDDRWIIAATCSIVPSTPSTDMATPEVDLSAFLLVLSTDDSKTECVLPFPVDARRASAACDPKTGVVEVRMPLLRGASRIEDGPDPGTRPWELQNALGGGAAIADGEENERLDERKRDERSDNPNGDSFGSYFVGAAAADEGVEGDDDARPLPEDAFHSRDVLSRHLLRRQEEEKEERIARNDDRGRDGADVERINVDDFRARRHDNGADDDEGGGSLALKKARGVMKNRLGGGYIGGDLVMGLV